MPDTLLSDTYLLKQCTREMENLFRIKYKNYLDQFRRVQQDPSMEPTDKVETMRMLSWKTFNLRFMMDIYLNMLGKEQRCCHPLYIHHLLLQMDEILTPGVREQHAAFLHRHEQSIQRLIERIWHKLYFRVNHDIYTYYNGPLLLL